MKLSKLMNRQTLLVALMCCGTMPMQTAHADPLSISDSPLFLLSNARPNIFFLFDDSGSMEREIVTNRYEAYSGLGYLLHLSAEITDPTSGAVTTYLKEDYGYVFDEAMSGHNDASDVVPHPDLVSAAGWTGGNIELKPWRAFTSSYNKLYYNPDITYKPWPGYPNANPQAVEKYPSKTATTDTFSLIEYQDFTAGFPDPAADPAITATMHNYYPAQYYYWVDDGDGVLEDDETGGDEHIQIFISPGGYSTNTNPSVPMGMSSLARPAASVQCATGTAPTAANPCIKRPYADEIQNFANWFVYYRSRLLTAKAAVALTIDDPFADSTRMGIATINDDSDGKAPLRAMKDDSLTPADTNKTTLLNTLLGTTTGNPTIRASGGTPLNEALHMAGEYFRCADSGSFFDSTCALEGLAWNSSTPSELVYTDNSAGECQQNYTIMITDGEYRDGKDDGSRRYNSGVGDVDADDTTNDFDGGPYADSESNTLADIAMEYYKNDLSDLMDPNVPINCGVDENPEQHMVTYTVTFGINGLLQWKDMPTHPIATTACGTVGTATAPTWPGSFTASEDKLDDVLHAAYNARGKYIAASSASELIDSLKTSLQDIAGRRGVSSAIGLSSTNNTGNTQAYLATFNSGGWYGELEAYTINSNGTLSTPANWQAHKKLNALTANAVIDVAQITAGDVATVNAEHLTRTTEPGTYVADSATNARAIITTGLTRDTTYGLGRPFRWANISTDLKNDLKTNSTGATDTDAVGQERLNYIRGDHRCEVGAELYQDKGCATTTPFRARRDIAGNSTRLGDLVNSTPVYVGESIGNYPSSAPFPNATGKTYNDYLNGTDTEAFTTTGKNTTNRTPVLYIGGNDGMLHAFNAGDTSGGDEVFAFIPRVFADNTDSAGLHKLTESGAHRSYVDLTPSIADAFTTVPADNHTTRKWRTVLVGGLRNGGKGIYALDITDPDTVISATSTGKETAAAKMVMWEFTSSDDADLGNTFSQPVIVPLRVNSGNTPISASSLSSDHAIEWFAVFGNGYNSTNGKAVLFLLRLSGPGSDNTWDIDTDYFKIDTGVGNNTDTRGNNGLSSPAVIDSDGDGIYDRVYAGDLWGDMWAFDISGNGPSDWDVAFKSGTSPAPLAIAKDSSGNTQPILAKPVITRNALVKTTGSNNPNTMVLFGTGRFMVDGDESNTSSQTFYGIWDDGSSKNISRTSTSDVLVQQTIMTETTELADLRTIDPSNTVNYSNSSLKHQGWLFDLPDSGERVVEKATLVGSTLFFSSIVPDATAQCAGGGYSWLNAFNPFTGQSPGIQVFNTNTDSIIDADDIPTEYSNNNVTVSGIKNSEMIPIFSYLADQSTSPDPCAEGSSVQGIGSSTNANVSTQQLCAEGGTSKAGRYSWRQLSFD